MRPNNKKLLASTVAPQHLTEAQHKAIIEGYGKDGEKALKSQLDAALHFATNANENGAIEGLLPLDKTLLERDESLTAAATRWANYYSAARKLSEASAKTYASEYKRAALPHVFARKTELRNAVESFLKGGTLNGKNTYSLYMTAAADINRDFKGNKKTPSKKTEITEDWLRSLCAKKAKKAGKDDPKELTALNLAETIYSARECDLMSEAQLAGLESLALALGIPVKPRAAKTVAAPAPVVPAATPAATPAAESADDAELREYREFMKFKAMKAKAS